MSPPAMSSEGLVLAHGVGARADLPVPLSLALYAAGIAVLVSFLALVMLWRTSKLRGDAAGRPLPGVVQAVVDAPVVRWALRLVVLTVTLLVVVVALVGPENANANLAPYGLYVTFWVGLVPVSLVLGPVWRVVNPLRTLHAPFARGGVQLVAALWFGPGWFARGDGFEVYSSLLARLSPLVRREDGRLVVRSPLDGLDGARPERGLVAVVLVLVGSTGFGRPVPDAVLG